MAPSIDNQRQQSVPVSGLGQISWVSPVARALLKSRVGDEVTLVTPQGTQVLEVLKVDYPAADTDSR